MNTSIELSLIHPVRFVCTLRLSKSTKAETGFLVRRPTHQKPASDLTPLAQEAKPMLRASGVIIPCGRKGHLICW